MSGDVQPRKRKDKKKKKADELTLEDSRGTSAVLGEGDVFIHTHSDHGTGGHWCAKIIFFSLLAVLITLIGLIIIENRGLSELEANSVESRYSGILEGWIEDVPDDDHHDIHTLELKHHDDEHDDEDDHDDGFEDGGSEEDDTLDHSEDEDGSQELDTAETEEVEYGFNHPENEDEDDNEKYNDEEQIIEEVDSEKPVESYLDYFFGSSKPQEESLSEEDEDDENDENDNDENDIEDGYENNLDYMPESDDDGINDEKYNDFADQNEEDEKPYQNENSNEVDNSYQTNDDDDNYQNDNDANKYDKSNENDNEDANKNDDWELNENEDNNVELQYDSHYDQNFNENLDQEEDDDHGDDDDEDEDDKIEEVEVERIEQEVDDQEPINIELPPLPEEDDDDDSADAKDDDDDSNAEDDDDNDDDADDDDGDDDDDDDFLKHDEIFDEPIVERISVPAGKPYAEVDEDDSTEQTPANTLADEEEYERRQEELRKEEAQASHVWLKLGVGAALLVATHAVVKRATSRDEVNSEDNEDREDTPPTTDRRMTLITEATTHESETQEAPIRKIEREVFQQIPHIVKSSPTPVQISLDDDEEVEEDDEQLTQEEEVVTTKTPEVELYSDEEIEETIEPIKETLILSAFKKSPEPTEQTELPSEEDADEEDEDDDVEIIGDEQIEEEEVEELDDEDISDVDDAELLSRLEAKYGSLSEPEKAPTKHKDGGDSVNDAWPGEPNDPFWKKELDKAEDELEQGQWSSAIGRATSPQLAKSSRARFITARAYDQLAEAKRDNKILTIAINAYVELLKNSDRISDEKLLEIANRTIERMHFRGTYMSAEPIHRLLIRRFPDNVGFRNNLTVSFFMANKAELAEEVLKETLQKWPNDRVSLAQYGFILKTQHNRLEEALEYLTKALENDTGPATEPRFYYHLGDTLLLLGRFAEAHEVHKRAAKQGYFLSPSQRSLYNVNRLKGKPWWNVNETPYERLAKSLEQNWRAILKEGLAAKSLYEEEKEGLREKGEWSQLDLFVRGVEVGERCSRAPVTCAAVRAEPAAVGCRRGQVKFSAIEPGTHVRPHVGPTNCRLRMHLGLSNTKDTYIRVDKETRQWQEGKVFIFDDSFEHEVWHNGTGSRLVLIVDVWHPELTPQERRALPAI